MAFKLEALPYEPGALTPHIGEQTVQTHYGKHHRGYVDKLNKAVKGTAQEKQSLTTLIREAEGDVFNFAAQTWNHTFYWRCMNPNGGGEPGGELGDALKSAFGTVDKFRQEFAESAKSEFGSGWAWLVVDPSGRLAVQSTDDAENPLQVGAWPLLTIDVWEHAYYLDYRNERGRYVKAFIDHLIDWEFVAENLRGAKSAR